MKGDLADLQNSLLGTADHNLQALTHVEVALIPVEAIQDDRLRAAGGRAGDVVRDPGRGLDLPRMDAERRPPRRAHAAPPTCCANSRCGSKLAGLGERDNYELPMTQEQLADALGLTSVHVNRTLMGLREDGLISRTQRSVQIADWHELAKVGDFDSAYLHLPERAQPAV